MASISRLIFYLLPQKDGCYFHFRPKRATSRTAKRTARNALHILSLLGIALFGLTSCSSSSTTTATPPNISTLSPTSGAVGTLVTITGTYFGSTQSTSIVTFDGTSAGTAVSWSATSIIVMVPPGATTGGVVINVAGAPSNAPDFTLIYSPGISSLSQNSGPVGTSITITGINFGATQGTSTVTFNGTSAGTASSWSATSITVTVPNGATSGFVVVTVSGTPSNGKTFTVTGTCCVLSGTVSGSWVADVAIRITGPVNASAITDANGRYSVGNLTPGSYTITPVLSGYVYTPASPVLEIARSTQQDFTAASAITSFSISGTVSYAGAKTGATFIRVYRASCYPRCGAVAGTSIPSPNGSYTVRGVQPSGSSGIGTYLVNAEIDAQGTGERNASNPSGNSSTMAITSANVAGVDITVNDQTAPAPVTPALLNAAPENNLAILRYRAPLDSNGDEIATSYKVYTGADASASNGAPVSFAAQGANHDAFVLSGLPNGAAYFKIAALNASGESAASAVVGPITIGAQTEVNTELRDAVASPETSAGATPWVTTNYLQEGSHGKYGLNLGIAAGTKRPIAVTVFSGPNLAVPFDLGVDGDHAPSPNFTDGAIPQVGDTYLFDVAFADGTSQILSASVTAVLDASSLARNLAMDSAPPYSPLAPLLTWNPPASAPPAYTYAVGVSDPGGASLNWHYGDGDNNGIPSTQTSLLFNADEAASDPILTLGTTYSWFVTVRDANGNSAQVQTIYTPQ